MPTAAAVFRDMLPPILLVVALSVLPALFARLRALPNTIGGIAATSSGGR